MSFYIKTLIFYVCLSILLEESSQFLRKEFEKAAWGEKKEKKTTSKKSKSKKTKTTTEKILITTETLSITTEILSTTPEILLTTTITNEPEEDGPACEKITDDFKAKINELRTNLEGKIPENSDIADYAKDDNYLLRWLIASGLDVNSSTSRINTHIKWRVATKVDEIENEDFGEIPSLLKFFIGGQDKDSRPVAEWWLHDADIEQMIQNKDIGILKVARWLIGALEGVTRKLYEMNVTNKKCVTQAVLLVDSHNLDANKHACQNCLKVFAAFAQSFETHYPNMFINAHFINTENPPFMQILKVMAAQFKQKKQTLAPFRLYKTDDEWKAALDNVIEPTQRSEKFGGTMET